MKFLVDAHLPPALCQLLSSAGHEALHTRDLLPARNETHDSDINDLSSRDQRVVITKDSDFYHSHLLIGRPWKLVLVRTGNIRTRDLSTLFARHLDTITAALEVNTMIELYREGVTVIR